MENLLKSWVDSSQDIISRDGYISIHLDELMTQPLEKVKVLQLSLKIFTELIQHIRLREARIIPLLTIPLRTKGNKITFSVPRRTEDVLKDMADEPPSFYLFEKHTDLGFDGCEEYRRPLPFNLIAGSNKNNVYSYYREFRYPQAIKLDWEFTRCLYIIGLVQK